MMLRNKEKELPSEGKASSLLYLFAIVEKLPLLSHLHITEFLCMPFDATLADPPSLPY